MGSFTALIDMFSAADFALRLKERRQAKSISQKQENGNRITQQKIAAQLGVTIDTVKGWERGEFLPSLPNLVKLCYLLDCDSDYLLGLSREPFQAPFDLQKDTGLSAKTCAHIHNLQMISTDYNGNTKAFGMKDVFDALAADDRFLRFLSECYMYMLTNMHYLESSVQARNRFPKDRRYEQTRFYIAKGVDEKDNVTIDAQDAAKCHEMRALEIMKDLLETVGDFTSPILRDKYNLYFADKWREAGSPTRIRMPDLPIYYYAMEISEDSLVEEFRLMIEAAESTLNQKRKHVTAEQAAFMENEFAFLLGKLSYLRSIDSNKAFVIGHRMALLLIHTGAHRIGFVQAPLSRIAAAVGAEENELLSALPSTGESV